MAHPWVEKYRTWRFPMASAEALSLDAEGRIGRTLPCYRCRYNLQSIVADVDGRCPECGKGLRRSLYNHRLAVCDPKLPGKIANGLLLLMGASLVCSLAVLVSFLQIGLFNQNDEMNYVVLALVWLITSVGCLMAGIGGWLYGSDDAQPRPYRWLTNITRWSVRVLGIGLAILVCLCIPILMLMGVFVLFPSFWLWPVVMALPYVALALLVMVMIHALLLTWRIPSWFGAAMILSQASLLGFSGTVAATTFGVVAGLPVYLIVLLIGAEEAKEAVDPSQVQQVERAAEVLFSAGVVVTLAMLVISIVLILLSSVTQVLMMLLFTWLLKRQRPLAG